MSFFWEYSDTVNGSRRGDLISSPDFEEIVKQVVTESLIVCAVKDPIKQHPILGYRVAYSLEVSQALFDIFFNSKNGYRAWYFRSPREGLEKNSLLIQMLTPKLVEADIEGDISRDDVAKSLKFPTAKAWFAETGNNLCDDCQGQYYAQDDVAEIFNRRWERWNTTAHPKSRTGRKAPFLNRIRIYGAFIRTDTGEEFVSPDKLDRAAHIFHYGAS